MPRRMESYLAKGCVDVQFIISYTQNLHSHVPISAPTSRANLQHPKEAAPGPSPTLPSLSHFPPKVMAPSSAPLGAGFLTDPLGCYHSSSRIELGLVYTGPEPASQRIG